MKNIRRGGSNEYPQSVFSSRNMKNISIFLSDNFHFWVLKFSVYLNRHVFVMNFEVETKFKMAAIAIFFRLTSYV